MATKTTYGQYCPVSRALDVLGERWSLMILRDLVLGSTRFNELARGLPGLSRSLLTKRLRQFERAGLVEKLGNEYRLTPAGEDLHPVILGIGAWGARWAFGEPRAEELDAQLLVWWIHGRIDTSDLPGKRHVVHFRFTDDPRPFWIVVEDGNPSVCMVDPMFEVDLTITSDVSTLYQVYNHHLTLGAAEREGRIRFDGAPAVVRRVPQILRLSPVADLVTPVA